MAQVGRSKNGESEAQTVGMDVSDHTQQRESVVGATTQVSGEMGNRITLLPIMGVL